MAESHWHAAETMIKNDKKYYMQYFYEISTVKTSLKMHCTKS